MADSYDLTKLDADSFEHMVNALALAVLGGGTTGFGPGADGGRDGYFEGEAPYPSATDRWKGVWYIQSKFHKPHLSEDPQKWLIEKIKEELKEFTKPDSKRKWPDNWIVATNIDPSGVPETGAFDRAKALVRAARPQLESRFHIWGGARILGFLSAERHVAERYGHFLTPGNVIAALMAQLRDERADIDAILQQLVVRQFKDQKLTKLEQAGSQADVRPAIHDLFVDLPFVCPEHALRDDVIKCFTAAARECHRIIPGRRDGHDWSKWERHPRRARVWFLRGGPGQGKSTIGQYFCQIQRAALLLADSTDNSRVLRAHHPEYVTAGEVREAAKRADIWPTVPRIPIHVELKDYAQWYGKKKKGRSAKGVLTFLAETLTAAIEQQVHVGTLKRALQSRCWVAVFDGLDEVPQDVKDKVAGEISTFVSQVAVEQDCDLLSLCTSRPQGYSGQFRDLDCASADLLPLPADRALDCARPVIAFQRPQEESRKAIAILEAAASSSSVRELLTTPLQAHIIAVVVRDGERPPERRWKLYDRFYDVIRRREANRNLPDARLARLLREDEKLLKTLHNRIGFRLHADAETSEGAETSLDREAFRALATRTVSQMVEDQVDQKVEILDKATTERLVLINTPENGTKLRFDIRQLQEFFAAECLYDSIKAEELRSRIAIIAGDAHWREVTHFLLSSLVENDRSTELSVAIEELCKLNEGDSDGADRMLSRRAGKGALISARLLSEGVLEQDKAIRQRFRECLTPMAAFANVGRLISFIGVRHENSSSWLMTFLLDKLRESAYAENIGAAIVLAHALPDSHHRVVESVQLLNKAPGNFIAAITESFTGPWSDVDRSDCPTWFCELLLQLLTKPNWSEIGAEGIQQAGYILLRRQRDQRGFPGAFLPHRYETLLPFLHLRWHERPIEMRYGKGNLRLVARSLEPALEEARRRLAPDALTGEAPGVFRVIQFMLLFSESPSRSGYLGILRAAIEAGEALLSPLRQALHIPWPLLPPASSLANFASELESMSDEQFTELLRSGKLRYQSAPSSAIDLSFDHDSKITTSDILECYNASPVIALEILVIFTKYTRVEFESKKAVQESVRQLLPLFRNDPTPLLTVPWSWKRLLDEAGENATELRELIFSSCRDSLPYHRGERHSYLFHRIGDLDFLFDGFRLVWKYKDSAILPYLTDLLLNQLRVYGDVGRHHQAHRSVLPPDLTDQLRGAPQFLSELLADTRRCWSVRCSACLLLMLTLEDPTAPLASVAHLFVKNCNSRSGQWLLDGLVTTLTFIGRKQSSALTALLRDLFNACREDYCARASLEQILMVWRETSTAPVTTLGLRDRWLYRAES